MAIVEGGSFGKYGQEAAGSLKAATAFWGSLAEHTVKKTEPTVEVAKEMFWYEVGKVTHRAKVRYVRPIRRWLR